MNFDIQLAEGILDISVLLLLCYLLVKRKKKEINFNPNIDQIKSVMAEATNAGRELNLELNTQQRELKDLLLDIQREKQELSAELIRARNEISRINNESKISSRPVRDSNYLKRDDSFSTYDPVFEYLLETPTSLPTFSDVVRQKAARQNQPIRRTERETEEPRLSAKIEVSKELKPEKEADEIGDFDDQRTIRKDPRLGVLGKI